MQNLTARISARWIALIPVVSVALALFWSWA